MPQLRRLAVRPAEVGELKMTELHIPDVALRAGAQAIAHLVPAPLLHATRVLGAAAATIVAANVDREKAAYLRDLANEYGDLNQADLRALADELDGGNANV